MNEEKNMVVSTEEVSTDSQFKAGEKGFALFWLLFGLFFFWQSLKLYKAHPGLSSCGAIPLFVTGVIVLCSLIILIGDRKRLTPNSGKSFTIKVKQTLTTLFPINVLVLLVLILLYCVGLYLGLGFYIVTPFFLWIAMMYFMKKQYITEQGINKGVLLKLALKNLLWTALSIAFIFVMFTFLFSVVLP